MEFQKTNKQNKTNKREMEFHLMKTMLSSTQNTDIHRNKCIQSRSGVNVILLANHFSRSKLVEVVIYSKLGFGQLILNYTIRDSRDQRY